MTVRRRGKSWMIDISVGKNRIRKTIKEARTKAEAVQAEAHIKNQLFRKKYDPDSIQIHFKDFVVASFLPYSKTNKRSHYDDKRIATVLCDFFSEKMLDEITPAMVEQFKQHRLSGVTQYKQQRKPATVNRELMVLSRIFTLAIDEGHLSLNPCSRVKRMKVSNARTRYLTFDEEIKLLSSLADQPLTRNIVVMALHTGMRRGEIFDIKWKDVDFAREVINIPHTKTYKARVVMMNAIVLELLRKLREADPLATDSAYVFASEKTGGRLNNIKRSFKTALRKNEIEDFRFHDLRHSAGTRLADAGVHITMIAEILGHSKLEMTKRYVHAADQAKREAMAKLAINSTMNERPTKI